ncbi:YlxM family DNA-binding protein [bacterium]|nr:YlxM family DNA-binding protein [bacterium]
MEAENQTQSQADPLDKVVRIGQLMDLYGGLLTDRQRLFVQLHYEDDMSFGEVARQHGVSRQAIHDAVKHAEQSLEDYESKLGLLAGGVTRPTGAAAQDARESQSEGATSAGAALAGDQVPAVKEAAERLRAIFLKLRSSGGIIYNAEGITREIGSLADELEKVAASGE